MKGLGDLMKQAKDMQENMQKMQEELASLQVQGESGAGMVKVTMTGRHDVKQIDIDPSLLAGDDTASNENKEMLEDLIAAAVNDAVRKVEEANRDKMGGLTAGMNIPGGLKFPF